MFQGMQRFAWAALLGLLCGAAGVGVFAQAGPTVLVTKTATESRQLMRFDTGEGSLGAGDFHLTIDAGTNPVGTRRDQVFTWGYNQGLDGGSSVKSGEHALSYRIENFFKTAAGEFTEAHLQYVSRGGTVYRPQAYMIDLSANTIAESHEVTSWGLNHAGTGAQLLKCEDGHCLLYGIELIGTVNGANILRQQNSAGTAFVNLARLTSGDKVEIGSPTSPVSAPSLAGSGQSHVCATATGELFRCL